MRNTFVATLLNPKRNIPFRMWWFGVIQTAFIQLFEALVVILSLATIMPNWTMWSVCNVGMRQFEYIKRNKNKE